MTFDWSEDRQEPRFVVIMRSVGFVYLRCAVAGVYAPTELIMVDPLYCGAGRGG